MKNKKLIIGIAAGAAILAGAAVLIARRRARKNNEFDVQEAKNNFKGKLNELQRKAQKEYKSVAGDAKDAVNTAKDRANEWVNKANA
jgi:gas vesicle protein